MPPKWTLASYALVAAGAAELATGAANRFALLSLLLGGATLAVGLVTLRRKRFDAGAWVVAVLGACLAFRVFVYQAPPLVLALVGTSSLLYVGTVFLGFSAWREEVQALHGARKR